MAIPAGEIGIGAVSGGALVGFIIKVLPVLLKKMNGRNSNISNGKPGHSKTCMKRGEKIVEHDGAIVGLCGSVERIEKQTETVRVENREDHKLMFKKLDELK